MTLTPIRVRKETVSDETYRLVCRRFPDGTLVSKGEVVAELETSKSTFEISTHDAGYVFYSFAEGAEVPVGATLAWINSENVQPIVTSVRSAPVSLQSASTVASGKGVRISNAAQALMAKHDLTTADFSERANVTRIDVESLLLKRKNASAAFGPALLEGLVMIDKQLPNLFILGGGGHAKMCIDLLHASGGWHIAGILDSIKSLGDSVLGVPIVGRDSDEAMAVLYKLGVRHVVNGIGLVENHRERYQIHDRLRKAGFELPNLIHPRAIVEPSSQLGEGNQIMAGAIVGSDVKIGHGCIINTGAIISHDCEIGDDVHIAPGAIIAGSVVVGERSLVGMGTTIYLGVHLGREVILSNGVSIVRNVPDGENVRALVVG